MGGEIKWINKKTGAYTPKAIGQHKGSTRGAERGKRWAHRKDKNVKVRV